MSTPLPNLYTDDWIADEILPDVSQFLRYSHPRGKWHRWNGSAWAEDNTGRALHIVRMAIRRLTRALAERAASLGKDEAKAMRKALNRLGEQPTQRRVMEMLASDPDLACGPDTFDQRPMELNTPACIVDLETGKTLNSDPERLHSKSTSVDPAPTGTFHPLWTRFIDEVTQGDEELQRYLQMLAGYFLTGEIREHTLTFIYGPGGNGKSVFTDTLSEILGDYATAPNLTVFTKSSGNAHSTELAGLMGSRLVVCPETQSGRSWDDQKIKAVTSGDPMRARFMRQDEIEFEPRFKLVVTGNHAPSFDVVDDAIRRRLNVIPFTFKPEQPDVDLPEKLKAEHSAILRWMIDGCLMWSREGLDPPEAVRARTEEYLSEQDILASWLEERCELDPAGRIARSTLFDDWRVWCDQHGEHPGSFRTFKGRLAPYLDDLPVKSRKVDRNLRGYLGLCLKDGGAL